MWFDRKRKGKKLSDDDWQNPHRSGSRDHEDEGRRTHFAWKAEEAVDQDAGAIIAVGVRGSASGDTTSIQETIEEVLEQVGQVLGGESGNAQP